MPTPVESMRLVATELQPLGLSFAFVGGCAVWLLVDEPDLTDFRPTEDVDIIVEVVTLSELYSVEERLRATGFRHDSSEGAPICRWIVKGCRVDIMPIDSRPLGMNSQWFREALESAKVVRLDEKLDARVITRPMFLPDVLRYASKIVEKFRQRIVSQLRLSRQVPSIKLRDTAERGLHGKGDASGGRSKSDNAALHAEEI